MGFGRRVRVVVSVAVVGVVSSVLMGVGSGPVGAEPSCPVGDLHPATSWGEPAQCVVHFWLTGGVQSFTVPDGVDALLWGVEGGDGGLNAWSKPPASLMVSNGPARGGRIQVPVAVSSGERFAVVVGGAGEGLGLVPELRGRRVVRGGYGGGGDSCAFSYVEAGRTVVTGGGGGGGGSFVFRADGDRSLVAAAGGAGGNSGQSGWKWAYEDLGQSLAQSSAGGSGGYDGSGGVGSATGIADIDEQVAATHAHPGRAAGWIYTFFHPDYERIDGADGAGPAVLGGDGSFGGSRGGDGACGGGDRFDPEVVARGHEAFGGGGGGGGLYGGGGGGSLVRPQDRGLSPLASGLSFSGGGSGIIAVDTISFGASPRSGYTGADGHVWVQFEAPQAPTTTTTTTTMASASSVPGTIPSGSSPSATGLPASTSTSTTTLPTPPMTSTVPGSVTSTAPEDDPVVLGEAEDAAPSGLPGPSGRPRRNGALARTGAPVGFHGLLGAVLVAVGLACLRMRRRLTGGVR